MASLGPWETIKVVGKGGSSTVYKARLSESGRLVAVKQIDTDGLTKEQVQSLKAEIETMKELSHPNIIQFLGSQQTANKIAIFLEFAERGSLRQYYQTKGPLKELQAANCTRQILLGLQYLHDNGIAHRDVKCANCLLTKENCVKLADFGASKRFDSESIVSGLKGTPNWMAPEVIRGRVMTSLWMKADVWSLGCTLVEMVTARLPFSEYDNPMTAMYHIANGKAPKLVAAKPKKSDNEGSDNDNGEEIPENAFSNEITNFIEVCCNADPELRPSVSELLNHDFVKKRTNTSTDLSAPKQNDGNSESMNGLVIEGKALKACITPMNGNGAAEPFSLPSTPYVSAAATNDHSKDQSNTSNKSVPNSSTSGKSKDDSVEETEYLDDFDNYEDDFEDDTNDIALEPVANNAAKAKQDVESNNKNNSNSNSNNNNGNLKGESLEQSATLAAGSLVPSFVNENGTVVPMESLDNLETPIMSHGRKKFFPENGDQNGNSAAKGNSNSNSNSNSINSINSNSKVNSSSTGKSEGRVSRIPQKSAKSKKIEDKSDSKAASRGETTANKDPSQAEHVAAASNTTATASSTIQTTATIPTSKSSNSSSSNANKSEVTQNSQISSNTSGIVTSNDGPKTPTPVSISSSLGRVDLVSEEQTDFDNDIKNLLISDNSINNVSCNNNSPFYDYNSPLLTINRVSHGNPRGNENDNAQFQNDEYFSYIPNSQSNNNYRFDAYELSNSTNQTNSNNIAANQSSLDTSNGNVRVSFDSTGSQKVFPPKKTSETFENCSSNILFESNVGQDEYAYHLQEPDPVYSDPYVLNSKAKTIGNDNPTSATGAPPLRRLHSMSSSASFANLNSGNHEKPAKKRTSKKSEKVRSRSANVASNGKGPHKLPALQTRNTEANDNSNMNSSNPSSGIGGVNPSLNHGLLHGVGSGIIGGFPSSVRAVHSAPAVSRSVNLPPIMKNHTNNSSGSETGKAVLLSKTPSHKKSNYHHNFEVSQIDTKNT